MLPIMADVSRTPNCTGALWSVKDVALMIGRRANGGRDVHGGQQTGEFLLASGWHVRLLRGFGRAPKERAGGGPDV